MRPLPDPGRHQTQPGVFSVSASTSELSVSVWCDHHCLGKRARECPEHLLTARAPNVWSVIILTQNMKKQVNQQVLLFFGPGI